MDSAKWYHKYGIKYPNTHNINISFSQNCIVVSWTYGSVAFKKKNWEKCKCISYE